MKKRFPTDREGAKHGERGADQHGKRLPERVSQGGDRFLPEELRPPSGRRGKKTEREAQQRVACYLGEPAV